MDLSSFKLDIDELITEFAEGQLRTLAEMKRVWLDRKFSYIFEARPSTNLASFMQSLYTHCISYMIPTNSLSHRLGGLYCLYCLYEIQPFKPSFKIYLSLGELRRLKALVVDAKEKGIKVVPVLVKNMLEKNSFLFGFVNIDEYSEKERIKELVDVQNACIKKMHEKLLANSEIERYLHMDMGMELDLNVLMKISTEYAGAKSLAIREASEVVDVRNIKHIAEDGPTIGDEVAKIIEEWGNRKEALFHETGSGLAPQPRKEDTELMRLPAPEPPRDDDETQHVGFLELLMGSESPQVNGNIQHSPANRGSVPVEEQEDQQDDVFEYAKDLEHQLSEEDEPY